MKRLIYFVIFLSNFQLFSQTYNPQAAADYAHQWCNGRNPMYVDYSLPINGGADCAAFVSQCLIAGGLSLAAGTDGHGAYVKPDDVIAGASQLVQHLVNYQNTSLNPVWGFNPPADHDVGDPMFYGYSTGIQASHSYFCSSLDWKATQLYSAHSGNVCDGDYLQSTGTNVRLLFFHMKASVSDPCRDCIRNNDEEGIDCGGPCPPCEHAPNYKSYVTTTNSLPTTTYAIKNITAGTPNGAASIKVLSGQNVNFYTAGTIDLLPGFEVLSGGTFNATRKGGILEITADCNEYCTPEIYTAYDRWCPWPWPHTNGIFVVDVANVLKVSLEVYRRYNTQYVIDEIGDFVYSNSVDGQDGLLPLWDLIECESPEYLKHDNKIYKYWAYVEVYPCEWGGTRYWYYWRKFIVVNAWPPHDKVKYESTNELEDINQFLHTDIDNMYKKVDSAPNFIIIPNPNSGTFQLETNFPLSEIGNLKIINSLGISVYETQSLSSNTIQLQNSASGMFFVVIVLKDGNMLTQKMMVQR